jgi:hypothetical protein
MAVTVGRKYGNKKAEEDGYTFDSKAEWRRYRELRLMERAGEIRQLTVHPRYDLWVGDVKVCTYVADFFYADQRGPFSRAVIEDVKGVRTAAYKLKKKLMLACLGIEVQEISA